MLGWLFKKKRNTECNDYIEEERISVENEIENEIDKVIDNYNMSWIIKSLLDKGFTNPRYIKIANGILIYMEKNQGGMTFTEAYYCKDGKSELHKGMYNLEFLKEFIYKREMLKDIRMNGKKICVYHVELEEVYPNQTGDFIGLLDQYGLTEEVVDLINVRGFNQERISCDRLQLPGNKFLITLTKLDNENYVCAYLCYGTDIVKFEGIFNILTLANEIIRIFEGDIEVEELS